MSATGWIDDVLRALSPGRRRRAVAATKLALGKSKNGVTSPGLLKLFIPTGDGGKLKLTTTDGQLEIYGPDSASRAVTDKDGRQVAPGSTIEFELADGKHGWYYIGVKGSQSYQVSSQLEVSGHARDADKSMLVPDNFWYFPWKEDANSAYKPGGSCDKYDERFGVQSKAWEKTPLPHGHFTTDPNAGWWGHCDAASCATGIFRPIQPSGSFAKLDLKWIATEVAMQGYDIQWGWSLDHGPGGSRDHPDQKIKCRRGAGDPLDKYVDELHSSMVNFIKRLGHVCLMDMRSGHETGGHEEVWNQCLYKFKTEWKESDEAEGSDDQKAHDVTITNTFTGNEDLLPCDDNPETGAKREQVSVYRLIFGDSGQPAPNHPKNDWQSVKKGGVEVFPPRYMCPINGLRAGGGGKGNPRVQLAHLEQLGVRKRARFGA